MKASKPTSVQAHKKRRLFKIAGVILIVLITVRLILPYWVLNYVNKRLENINGYVGHIKDINLSLIRGAYVVKDIYINKVDSATQKQTPLFVCPNIDISLAWAALFKGRIVTEMEFTQPSLQFTEDKTELNDLEKDTTDFRQMLRTFTPFKVNYIKIMDGKIGYLDNTVKPIVDIQLEHANILAQNLSNVNDTTLLPANIRADADVYGGRLSFNMRMDAWAKDPQFDMNMELKDANLVKLNDFFKAYANLDMNKGTFGMYMEMAAQDRKYIGYVKPFIADLDVVGPEDKKDNLFQKIWENLVSVVAGVLENNETDKVATKIPIVGEYGDQTIGVWYAVFAALRNGFVRGIYPALDNQVNIGTIKSVNPKDENKDGFFKKVFGKPGTDRKEQRKEKKEKKKKEKNG